MLSKINYKESSTDYAQETIHILDSVQLIIDTDDLISKNGLVLTHPVKHLKGLLLSKCTSERAVSTNLKYLDSLYYLECALKFGTKVALLCSSTDLLILNDLKRQPVRVEVMTFKNMIIVTFTPTILKCYTS